MTNCVICSTEKHPRQAEHGLLCLADSNRILRWLRELEEYLPTLVLLKPAVGSREYISSQFGSRSPANDNVIVHTDHRSGTEVTVDGEGRVKAEYSALGVASSWAAVVAEEREIRPEKTPFLSLSLLRRNHDWIVHQPWVDEYAGELRQVHASVRVLAHDPIPRSVGKCISIDKRGYDCGGQVFEMQDASGVKCSRCNRRYDGTDLIRFRIAQDGETG